MEKVREKAIEIIDVFENYLNEKGIIIPNSEKNDIEDAANIYGLEYFALEDEITEIIKR